MNKLFLAVIIALGTSPVVAASPDFAKFDGCFDLGGTGLELQCAGYGRWFGEELRTRTGREYVITGGMTGADYWSLNLENESGVGGELEMIEAARELIQDIGCPMVIDKYRPRLISAQVRLDTGVEIQYSKMCE